MSGVPFPAHQAVRESSFGIVHCVLLYFQQGSIDSILTSHYWEEKSPHLVCLFSHSSFQWSLKSLLAQRRWSIFSWTPLPLHPQNQTLLTTSFSFSTRIFVCLSPSMSWLDTFLLSSLFSSRALRAARIRVTALRAMSIYINDTLQTLNTLTHITGV